MAVGAGAAGGEWLLFTDADTVHRAGSLAQALKEAKQRGAALLSYSPEQEVHGFWEKAAMPVIFAELASTYRPTEVSDPASSAAAANGQYLMISREAYDAVGGWAAVAGTMLEDVALARKVKASGRRIFFRYGGDAVRTRMYRSFAHLREGWTKNLALLFPRAPWVAALRLLEFLWTLGGVALASVAIWRGRTELAVAAAVLVVLLYALHLRRIRRAHFRWDATLLAIFGLPVFSYLLLRSRLSYRRGSVPWKGRRYRTGSQSGAGAFPPPLKQAERNL
jgi:hypothetical protein